MENNGLALFLQPWKYTSKDSRFFQRSTVWEGFLYVIHDDVIDDVIHLADV